MKHHLMTPAEHQHRTNLSTHTHSLFKHTHTYDAWREARSLPRQRLPSKNKKREIEMHWNWEQAHRKGHVSWEMCLCPLRHRQSSIPSSPPPYQSWPSHYRAVKLLVIQPDLYVLPLPPLQTLLAWCILIEGYIHARARAKQGNSNHHAVWSVSAVSKKIKMSGLTEEVKASEN